MIKNRENGRSMIEMLGVLAVTGVLSVGGIVGYSKAMTKYRINKTIEQITQIAGNIRSFFAPQKNYLEVICYGIYCNSTGCMGYKEIDSLGNLVEAYNGCTVIKKAKIFPDEMLTLSDDGKRIMAITNPFGFTTVLEVDNKSIAGDNKAFSISYFIRDNLEACIELMTQDWSTANIKAIRLDNGLHTYFKTPVSIDKATEKCAASIDAETDERKERGFPKITFYFDIDLNGSYWNPKAQEKLPWQN